MNPSPPVALLACEVFSSEIALHAREDTHIVETRWLEVGLHDQPDNLRRALQREVEALDARDDIQAIVLAYGLCGLGTAGLTASRHPLVIARAHDCITVFLGSKEAYADCQRRCPGCHYYTPGWNRERRVPGPDRTEMLRARFSEKFDPEDVEFLLETEREQWNHGGPAIYMHLGTPEAAAEEAYARRCADWLGWEFESIAGDPQLLRDLLHGPWDEARFLVVPPGQAIRHAPDESILRAQPV